MWFSILEKMAVSVILALLFVSLLPGQGFSQCFTGTDCTGDEVVALDERDCCVGTDDGLSFSDGSNCSLCIVHGFLQAEYDVDEDGRLDTMFQLNVKGTTPFDSGLIVSGIVTATADGTASTSDFQRLTPIRVTNSAEIRLFANNDEITLEYDDRVLLSFTPDNPGLIPGLEGYGEYIRDTATVHIIDNDLLQINFGESDYRVFEGSERLSSPITLQFGETQNPFDLTLTPVTVDTAESMGLGFFIIAETIALGFRATAGADFRGEPVTVVVPAGSLTFTVPEFFTIVDDDIDENEQIFAIVAEIGPDVSKNINCFIMGNAVTECLGRRGATEIRIADNDAMIIGFTERIRTVSEGQEGAVDLFQLHISASSVMPSEREHPMLFRLLESSTNATVETLVPASNVFDATFGSRANPIEETMNLLPGERTVSPPLVTAIRNDLIPEEIECYTIRIFPVDILGRRELFTCNEDSEGADSYFCEHTICIEDDDAPSGPPVMLTAVTGKRQVLFSWSPPPVTQHNGVLTNYTISCSPSPSSLPQSLSHHQNTSTTVAGFSPKTLYTCSVAAWNTQGSGPPAYITFTTLEDYAFFQLRLGGLLSSCLDLANTERITRLEGITREVVEKLAASCSDCSITNDIIDKQSFFCYQESPSFLTYRARLQGTSERDSSSLVSLIEAWVRGGATVIVTGVLLQIDSECPVAISSLSDKKCVNTLPPRPSPTLNMPASYGSDGTPNTSVIVMVVVVVVIAIAIVIALIIGVLFLRKHQAKLKNATKGEPYLKEGGTIKTSSNEAYGEVKRGEGEGYEMVDIPPSGPTADDEDESTSVSTQPLPPIPPTATDKEEDEDGVYEAIPGDN